MFGAKYSRLKFWIVSICLLIPAVISNVFVRVLETSENNQNGFFIFLIINFVVVTLWINTLANRIRDYGSNPWISLFTLIPFVNIGLALYYGIVKAKNKPENNENIKKEQTSLVKAVINHSKDIVNEIKPVINEYKEKHNSLNTIEKETMTIVSNNLEINEDEIYEQIMIEIEEDKKIKSTWAKALAQSDGDDKKANSLYINLRVEKIKEVYQDQVEIQRSQEKKGKLKALDGGELNKQELSLEEKGFLKRHRCDEKSINVEIDYEYIKIRRGKIYFCFKRDENKVYSISVEEFRKHTGFYD